MNRLFLFLTVTIVSMNLCAQWNTLHNSFLNQMDTFPNVFSIDFINVGVGVSIGVKQATPLWTIDITKDSGRVWKSTLLIDSVNLSQIQMLSDSIFFVIGKPSIRTVSKEGVLLSTFDEGNSWVTQELSFTPQSLSKINDSSLIIIGVDDIGGNGAIQVMQTKNSGGSWTTSPISALGTTSFANLQLLRDSIAFVYLGDNLVYRAFSQAGNWVQWTASVVDTNQNVSILQVLTGKGNKIFALAQHGGLRGNNFLYESNDFGLTWSNLSTAPLGALGMSFFNDSVGWYVGTLGIYKTIDGGRTWGVQSFYSGSSQQLNQFHFHFSLLSDSSIYLAGEYQLYSTHNGGGNTIITSLEQNVSLQRNHRIYPNPTTGQFLLELEVTPNEQIQLELYDVQGKLQLEQALQATNVHSIDVAELPKGLYVYRVVNSQGASFAGKLMVE